MNAMRRDYLRRKAREVAAMEPQSMEMGWPFRVVIPSDVRDLKNRLDAYVRALDSTVETCKGLPQNVIDGWKVFSKAWRTYFDEDDSWWHTAAQMDQGEAYEGDIKKWQQLIGSHKCEVSAPEITRLDEPAKGSGDFWSSVKVIAIAGALIAVALGVKAALK
jgi:hypothetical protein